MTIDSPGDTPPPLVASLDMDTDPEGTAAAALAASRIVKAAVGLAESGGGGAARH